MFYFHLLLSVLQYIFNDLSLIVEYTIIRPYVYTHFNILNNYSAFGVNLGHRIGPNADELILRSNYNFNEWIRFTFEYRYQRSGENIYAEDGTLLKNVVGDITLSHGYALETDRAYFLDGDGVNTNFFSTGVRVEPIRNFIFDVSYNYMDQQNTAMNISDKESYELITFTLEY